MAGRWNFAAEQAVEGLATLDVQGVAKATQVLELASEDLAERGTVRPMSASSSV